MDSFNHIYFLQEELQHYGVDWDGPLPQDALTDTERVEIPDTGCPLDDVQFADLSNSIDPLRQSTNHGIDIYMETIYCVSQLMLNIQ